jgi:hypothetical protein
MPIKWTPEQNWQLLITTCHKIEDKRLTHKDKAFIKRLTQKERENGLPNQFIIKSLKSGKRYDENVCSAEKRDDFSKKLYKK